MNRTQLLIIAVVAMLVFTAVYRVWADWGLVTIHAKQQPLGKIVASMARQGHATIRTDIPGDTLVTMNVTKVHLADALEVLSGATQSRWRLLYFVAGDKSTLKSAELSWFEGQRPDGWKMVSFPFGNMFASDDDSTTPDPREDVWTPKTAAPAPVQTFLSEAAEMTNAGFAFPESWNPTVKSAPSSGVVDRVVPKLVSAAGGREDPVFFLSKMRRRGPRTADGDNNNGGPRFDPTQAAMFADRIQAEIKRLPSDQQADAQAAFNAEKAFRDSLKNLTDDQRRAAWQQHMQDPQVQQQMANRLNGQDARLNHDQRVGRARNYVSRRLAATGK